MLRVLNTPHCVVGNRISKGEKRAVYVTQFNDQPVKEDCPSRKYLIEHHRHASGAAYYQLKETDRIIYDVESGERYLHEVLHPDRKCKVFMDCDRVYENDPNHKPTDEYIYAYVNLLHERVIARLKTYGCTAEAPLIFTATRPGKLSLHVVWTDSWCETPAHVRELLQPIAEEKISDVTIDLQVFPVNDTPKTIRMPYCFKPGGYYQLRPMGCNQFDITLFCKGLVTFNNKMSSSHPYLSDAPTSCIPVVLPERTERSKNTRAMMASGCRPIGDLYDGEDGMYQYLNDGMYATIEWMEQIYPEFTYQYEEVKVEESWFRFISQQYCENAQRYHARNKTYIKSNEYGSINLVCPDEECRAQVELPFTIDDILLSLQPLDIDFDMLPSVETKRVKTVS